MIDFSKVPSPCYLLDEQLLDQNLATIDRVRKEAGVEIIVALKACAMWSIFPELARHSDGATASSPAEAQLVFEEYGKPAHTYAPVYTDSSIEKIMQCSDHITFNSVAQYNRFAPMAILRGISCGLRINPKYSPVETDLYNPCVAGSRLGVTAEELNELPAGLEGLHFHVLCESRPHHLKLALEAVEEHFGHYLDQIKWLNMGGGHLMTHAEYDEQQLIDILRDFRARHPHLRVILEPGSAFTWRTGELVATVEDVVNSRYFRSRMAKEIIALNNQRAEEEVKAHELKGRLKSHPIEHLQDEGVWNAKDMSYLYLHFLQKTLIGYSQADRKFIGDVGRLVYLWTVGDLCRRAFIKQKKGGVS